VVETDAKSNQLLEAIVEHEAVKAAALLDGSGDLERLEGDAEVFDAQARERGASQGEETGREDVFIESLVDRFLVVVFAVEGEFEPIKQEVEELIDRLEL